MQNISYRQLGKLISFIFPFLTSVTLFSPFLKQKLFKYVQLTFFMHTIQNNTISLMEIQASFLLKCKALYVNGTPDH